MARLKQENDIDAARPIHNKVGTTHNSTNSSNYNHNSANHSKSKGLQVLASIGVCVFIAFLVFIFIVTLNIIKSKINLTITIPRNLSELKQLNSEFAVLKDDNYNTLLLFFCTLYILKQTFCIPGSIWLNLWAGSMFGLYVAFPLCCFLTTFGASCCYWLSHLVFRRIVERFFSKRIHALNQKIQKEAAHNLLWYLLFLRVVPFTPNWLLNLASPIVGIPFKHFAISIFFGLIPYNLIGVQTGTILSDLSEGDDIFDIWTIAKLLSIACVYLLLMIGKNHLTKKHTPSSNGTCNE